MENNAGNKMNDLVVKSNRLNSAIQKLSLVEIRLIQLAIVDARETGKGIALGVPLCVSAQRYAQAFGVAVSSAYDVLSGAEEALFERRFSFVDDRDVAVKTRWVESVAYLVGSGAIEIIFSSKVVNEITRIDGLEDYFTKYLLSQTASLQSVYSVRLYELLVQWRSAKKTPLFELDLFREQIGLGVNDYSRMSDFKRRVLDAAVKEINDKTNIKITYEQIKKGTKIAGFKFSIHDKPTAQIAPVQAVTSPNSFVSGATSANSTTTPKPPNQAKKPPTIPPMSDKQRNTFAFKIIKNFDFVRDYSAQTYGKSTEYVVAMIEGMLADDQKRQQLGKYLFMSGYELPARPEK